MHEESLGILVAGGGPPGGGYIQGSLMVLEEEKSILRRARRVVGTSVGAIMIPHLVSEKVRRASPVWTDGHLRRLVNWKRPLRPLDLHYLMKTIKRICPMDIEAIRTSPIPIEVTVTCCNTGESLLIDLRSVENIPLAVMASAALPPFHQPVLLTIRGEKRHCIDGGLSRELPINRMLETVDSLLVILSWPKELPATKIALPWRWWAFPRPFLGHIGRKTMRAMHEQYNESLAQLLDLEKSGRVHIIAPKKPLVSIWGDSCFRWRLGRSPAGIRHAMRLGAQDAKELITSTQSLAI